VREQAGQIRDVDLRARFLATPVSRSLSGLAATADA
jgi:hypothetical protein